MMKRALLLLLIAVVIVTAPGCSCMGLNSQDDMRQYARKRSPEPEEEKTATPTKPDKPEEVPAAKPEPDASTGDKVTAVLPTTLNAADVPDAKTDGGVSEETPAADAETEDIVDHDPATPAGELSESQQRSIVIDRMQRIGTAIDEYVQETGRFPTASIMNGKTPVLSWRVALLPWLGYEELFKKFDTTLPWDHPKNAKLANEIPHIFQDPARRDSKNRHFTNILAVVCNSSIMTRQKARRPSAIEDGVDNTIMILEANDTDAIPWTMPREFEVEGHEGNADRIGSKRSDGTFVLWGGGLVSLVPTETPNKVVWTAITAESGDSFKIADLYHKAVGDPNDTSAASLVTVVDHVGGTSKTGDTGLEASETGTTTDRNATQDSPATTFSARFPFYDFAIRAIAESRNRDASRYLHAAMLIDPTDEWMQRIRWSNGLRRPIAETNWGLGSTGVTSGKRKTIGDQSADNKEEIVADFKDSTGELGERFLELIHERADRGKFGPLIQGGVLSSQTTVETRIGGEEEANARNPSRGKIKAKVSEEDRFSKTAGLFPGVTVLGNNTERVLIELAKKREVDVLALFQVTVKQTTRTGVMVTAQIKFIDGMTGDLLAETDSINNIEVRAARADPLREDPTVAFHDEVEGLLRNQFDLTNMPAQLKSAHVRRRVGAILTKPVENPMRYLVELRYYQAADLLTGTEYQHAVREILGENAVAFLTGSQQEKLGVLLPWMPKEYLEMIE